MGKEIIYKEQEELEAQQVQINGIMKKDLQGQHKNTKYLFGINNPDQKVSNI